MRWYDWLIHLKSRAQVFPIPHVNLYLLFPPESVGSIPSAVPASEVERKAELAHELFTKQPDLLKKYGYTAFVPSHDANKKHPVYRFVQRQYYWMQQGLTKEAAYGKAEQEFGEVFLAERKHANLLQEVASYHSAVSYHSYYQSVAAHESSLRAERLLADLEKHKRAKNYSEIDQKISSTFKSWERIRARYYPQDFFVPNAPTAQEVKTRFFSRVEFLVNTHAHKAAVRDGLRALHDDTVYESIHTAPKLVGEQFKALYAQMVELGVTVSPDGQLDTSKITNPELVKNIRNSELLRLVMKYKGKPPAAESAAPSPPSDLPPQPTTVNDSDGFQDRRDRLHEVWKQRTTQSNP